MNITTSVLALVGVCCEYGPNPKDPSSYNYQECYFVECYCDCPDTMKKCPKCEHSREPRFFKQIILSAKDYVKKSSSTITVPTMQSFTHLIKKYKHY